MLHTFPMPVCPSVADLDAVEAGDPWYISLFFFTPGVARLVPLDTFRHFEQTIAAFESGKVCLCSGFSREFPA